MIPQFPFLHKIKPPLSGKAFGWYEVYIKSGCRRRHCDRSQEPVTGKILAAKRHLPESPYYILVLDLVDAIIKLVLIIVEHKKFELLDLVQDEELSGSYILSSLSHPRFCWASYRLSHTFGC